ncbi:hypothetical protein [Lysobacter gummosus]|uniref:hypothetical protein n=1 Tax=Lysobacter gummosus TaxID=262324 RepID=UPI003640123C
MDQARRRSSFQSTTPVPNSAQRRAFVYSGLKSLAHEIFRCIATCRGEPAEFCIFGNARQPRSAPHGRAG